MSFPGSSPAQGSGDQGGSLVQPSVASGGKTGERVGSIPTRHNEL